MADVLGYLVGRGTPFLVLPVPDAPTPEEAAGVHGVKIGELVRTEVMVGASGTALAVIPAARLIEVDLARKAMADGSARLATHAEIRSSCPGCVPGAVPPLSLFLRAPMYVDPAVADLEQVVFPAGRPGTLVCMQREELFREDPFVVAALTRESHVPEPLIAPSRRAILRDEELLPFHLTQHLPAGVA